jgi:ParB family chromosome partitioning protein
VQHRPDLSFCRTEHLRAERWRLTGLALRLVLSDHIGIPHESQLDLLTEAEQVFAPTKPKVVKAKTDGANKPKPTAAKAAPKKETTRKKAA